VSRVGLAVFVEAHVLARLAAPHRLGFAAGRARLIKVYVRIKGVGRKKCPAPLDEARLMV